MSGIRFELPATDPRTGVRLGPLHTPHGSVPTPTFMPVGTLGTVKAVTPDDVRSTGARIVLSNAYHLMLQPGVDVVERLGGLHAFMRWDGPMLTDSGGFQVFSLGGLREITDAGVTFASHLDGRSWSVTPESVIETEERLGADLIMPLDECVAADASRDDTERALERTQRWWRRSLAARRRADQALFALVQGGMFADLRREAASAAAIDRAPGYAIGGLSVGEPKELTADLVESTTCELPTDAPRYLMGVGHPLDLQTYATRGIDLFDCVLPTRLGRNGTVWTDRKGSRLDMTRRAMLEPDGPIMDGCDCPACTAWSVGRLAALFHTRDPLAYRLASVHNLAVLGRVARELRESVIYTPQRSDPLAR
ncbi:MAG: tRNA guanosine(34) transglycosylase Tgt [Chloroflexota bacterium]